MPQTYKIKKKNVLRNTGVLAGEKILLGNKKTLINFF